MWKNPLSEQLCPYRRQVILLLLLLVLHTLTHLYLYYSSVLHCNKTEFVFTGSGDSWLCEECDCKYWIVIQLLVCPVWWIGSFVSNMHRISDNPESKIFLLIVKHAAVCLSVGERHVTEVPASGIGEEETDLQSLQGEARPVPRYFFVCVWRSQVNSLASCLPIESPWKPRLTSLPDQKQVTLSISFMCRTLSVFCVQLVPESSKWRPAAKLQQLRLNVHPIT